MYVCIYFDYLIYYVLVDKGYIYYKYFFRIETSCISFILPVYSVRKNTWMVYPVNKLQLFTAFNVRQMLKNLGENITLRVRDREKKNKETNGYVYRFAYTKRKSEKDFIQSEGKRQRHRNKLTQIEVVERKKEVA